MPTAVNHPLDGRPLKIVPAVFDLCLVMGTFTHFDIYICGHGIKIMLLFFSTLKGFRNVRRMKVFSLVQYRCCATDVPPDMLLVVVLISYKI